MTRYLLPVVLAFNVSGLAAQDLESAQAALLLGAGADISGAVAVNELPTASGYLAQLDTASPDGLQMALRRAEVLFLNGRLQGQMSPASFVLHGPEVSVFFRDNYQQHKGLVDLAARLSAFGVIDIQVCETQTGVLGRDRTHLMPFVGTVPFGPAEEERLIQREGYVYF